MEICEVITLLLLLIRKHRRGGKVRILGYSLRSMFGVSHIIRGDGSAPTIVGKRGGEACSDNTSITGTSHPLLGGRAIIGRFPVLAR